MKGRVELCLKHGVGDSTRLIPIHSLASNIRPDLCKVLPAIHTLTGCDYTSKVQGTKQTHLKRIRWLTTDDDVANAEAYIVRVLKKGTRLTTMDDLPDHLFHHRVSLE